MKFEVSSHLKIKHDAITELFSTDSVARELSPIIRMTIPWQWSNKPIDEWPTGKQLFSSWILLFGIIPIDRHTFFFQSIDAETGFVETSSTLIHHVFRHERTIRKFGTCYQIIDHVEFQCRLPIVAYILAPVYRFVFKHRHRMLRKYYGSCER